MHAAALGVLLTLAAFPAFAVEPEGDEARVFKAGDRVLVLGRLGKCMSWSDRPLQIEIVPESGSVALLGLPAVAVLAKSPKVVRQILLAHYHKALPERALPPLRVGLIRGERDYEIERTLYHSSLRAMIHHECPTGPWQSPDPGRHYQSPPPGVPGLLENIA